MIDILIAQRPRSAPRATARNLKTPSRFVARVRWIDVLGFNVC